MAGALVRLPGEIRLAWRSLWATPGVTATALVLLALGIGASTAVYSVVDGVLLRALPFERRDRLMAIRETDLASGQMGTAAYQNYLDWIARQDVFDSMGGSTFSPRYTTKDQPVERLLSVRLTASLFRVLGVRPALGRPFNDGDERPGAPLVAILSDHLWRQRYQGDPHVIGRTLSLDAGVYEIVGVMPPGFSYPVVSSAVGRIHFWTPFVPSRSSLLRDGVGRNYLLSVVGRLKDGVTVAQASAAMTRIRDALAREHPAWFADRGIAVVPLQDVIVGTSTKSWLWFLFGAVGCVLLVACLNVASLLLARAVARAREIAVRSALGASRWSIGRALVLESLLLSTLGAAGGVLLSLWGV
jgi:predicted permease